MIGDIFNLTKEQVRYERVKNNISNIFLKKMIDSSDYYVEALEKAGILDIKEISKEDHAKLYLDSIRVYSDAKGQKKEICEKYINEIKNKNTQKNYNNIDLSNLELEYDVVVDKYENISEEKRKKTKKTTSGKKNNQIKNNITKINIGKLGEKIVFDYEKKKLKELGLDNLSNKVKWITKTENENITLDRLGYDIISYNEKGEKIYIEVKTSSTNTNDNIYFYISNNEINFIKGKYDNINKNNKYIYYVSNINMDLTIAKILIIDSKTFFKFKLEPINYKVCEKYNK